LAHAAAARAFRRAGGVFGVVFGEPFGEVGFDVLEVGPVGEVGPFEGVFGVVVKLFGGIFVADVAPAFGAEGVVVAAVGG